MSAVWGLTQLVAVAVVLCAVVALLATTAAYPRLRQRLAAMEPSRRSLAILLIALTPVLIPMAVTLAALVPPVAADLFSLTDHCVAHHDGHPHLCPIHLPAGVGPLTGWLLIAVTLVVLGQRVSPLLLRGAHSFRTVLRLRRSLVEHTGDVVWFEDSRPYAFTVGWISPKTLVSTGVRGRLSEAGMQVLLDHEQEHRRRRDPLQRSLLEAVCALFPHRVREMLVADWQLAAEQSCDRVAADRCGDSVEVAQALLAFERALTLQPAPGVAFGGSVLAKRVQYMLDGASHRNDGLRVRTAVVLAVATLLAASPAIHHGLETVLEALLG